MTEALTGEDRVALFARMLLMRRFEEMIIHVAQDNTDIGRNHLYIGHEATGAAVAQVLQPGDLAHTTHRNHGHLIARGADPGKALAEIMGRAGGLNQGRGGTWHLTDREAGFRSTSAMVGGSIGLSIGSGYALRELGTDNVAVAFFGDGVLDEGISYEALNFASQYDLPVLFVCENNEREGAHETSRLAASRLTDVPRALGIEVATVDGHDADAVAARTAELLVTVRGGRPVFLESQLERWPGSHQVKPEFVTGVTDLSHAWDPAAISGEHAGWIRDFDPILRFARTLLDDGTASREEIAAIDARTIETMAAARAFAEASPYPDPEAAAHDVFAERSAADA
ncbi:MAG: thiamine pyrophosphate-dependent dehydrogenase E1 component subunit alpha [Alphaproteobacteria bacterium]|nr:thiamine pyrophosphate-dependent dehydrogenase E1 component subunit alpha [Alphaproteobacteria bacterium]